MPVQETSLVDLSPSKLAIRQLDVEVAIESDRILHVLNETICRLELAASLPALVADNMQILRPHLTPDERVLVAKCLKYSTAPSRRTTLMPAKYGIMIHKDKDDHHNSWGSIGYLNPFHPREEPDICRIMQMLYSKPRFRKLVLETEQDRSPGALHFLNQVCQLRNCVALRLGVSPPDERMRDAELRSAWRRNEKAKIQIITMGVELEKQRAKASAMVGSKKDLIHRQEVKIAKVIHDSRAEIKNTINESERYMVNECKNSEARQEILSTDVKSTQAKLAALLAEHLLHEKELRAKRFKVESQLSSWLDKYDQDIGEKQAEIEAMTEGYEEEKRQMDELQEAFDAMEVEYCAMMDEKEAEYMRIRDEKMYKFILNRSARRIQRCWRAYRARKLARKLARRKKKGGKSGGGGGKGGGGGGKGGGGGAKPKGAGKKKK